MIVMLNRVGENDYLLRQSGYNFFTSICQVIYLVSAAFYFGLEKNILQWYDNDDYSNSVSGKMILWLHVQVTKVGRGAGSIH